jgi:Glycosyl transferase family 2
VKRSDDVIPQQKRRMRDVPSTPRERHRVSVLVTSYNYARFLPTCVESILGQRDVELELVIVDDCSKDETPEVTARWADDPRVTVVRWEQNRGMVPSVNAGFDMLSGEFVLKVDADDVLTPGAIARAVALLEANPDVTFVYGRPRHFTDVVPTVPDAPTRSWSVWHGGHWVDQRCRSATNVISQPEVVMRASALRRALPIRAELPHTSDLHLWLQLASLGEVGRINGPVQGCYRVHAASMQRSVHSGLDFDLRSRRDAFDSAFALQAGELPGAERLHALARRTLAADALDLACRAYDRGHTAEYPVDALIAFALDTTPDARELPEWAALERRKAVGARLAPTRFVAAAVARRVSEEIAKARWLRTGELA